MDLGEKIFEKKDSFYEHLSSYYQPPSYKVTLSPDAKAITLDNSKPGMYVTARNLSVQVGDPKQKNVKTILKDLNFFLKPGTLTLLLGTPGCGKTCLMKVLANQTHDEKVGGTLRFNGKSPNETTHHRDVCYVVQEDLHMPSLTVKDTLQFSADMQMNEQTTKDEKKKHIDHLLNILQLEKQADTVVGNQFIRGISGGQKKRVTIGVELVKSDAKLYLLDEISTGLDSCTTLEIIKALKEKVRKDNISCLVSLLQPGSEITKLFDFLMILSAGHMVYFGPNSSAIPYFESYGFKLPLHHNPAELYQEIVDEPELYFPSSKLKKREKSLAEQWFMSMGVLKTENQVRFEDEETDDVPLRGTFEFAETYKESSICRYILAELDNRQPNINKDLYRDSSQLKEYPTSIIRQIQLITKQKFTMMKSDPTIIRMRLISAIVMGLILGSLYWQLNSRQTDGQNRSGLLFFALTFVIYGGFGAIPVLFETRDIFYMQRDGRYYKSVSFFFAQLFSELPVAFIESLLFSILVYWMCGLQRNGEKFIFFVLMMFATNMQTQTFFRMISTFCPSQIIAAIVGPGVIAPLILFSGYMIAPKNIPGWWIYLYWISPIHYEFEGLMTNEHHGLQYSCTSSELVPPLGHPLLNATFEQGGFEGKQVCPLTQGDQFLNDLGMPQNDWFKWIDLLVVFGFDLLFSVIMYLCMDRIHFNTKVRASDSVDRKRVNRLQRQRSQFEQKKAYRQSVQIYQSQVELCHQLHKRGTLDQAHLEQLMAQQEQMNSAFKVANPSKIKIEEPKEVPRFRAENNEEILVGCYVQWKNLSYEVDIKKDGKKQRLRLLDNINGYVKPGMLLALMGPSGAGKSTLLDVLANRKTGGHIKGEILINGKSRDSFFTRISGYVEQFDVLPPTQTVREAIQFSARTRLPAHKPDGKKMRFVENILDALNLLKIANRSIGLGDGLSLAQRKRINIGIELAADPQLLFLDEPTSGLDSSAALKVMKLIKRISNSGRSVICTIHQPSTLIFKQFDHLLLLKKGGETVYFGPTGNNSKIVLDYFASHGLHCDSLKNPADFILEVTEDVVKITPPKGGDDLEKENNIQDSRIVIKITDPTSNTTSPAINNNADSNINSPPLLSNEIIPPVSPDPLLSTKNSDENNINNNSHNSSNKIQENEIEETTKEILNMIDIINDSCTPSPTDSPTSTSPKFDKDIDINNNNAMNSSSKGILGKTLTSPNLSGNNNSSRLSKTLTSPNLLLSDNNDGFKKHQEFHPVQSFVDSDLNRRLLQKIDGHLMPNNIKVPEYNAIYASSISIQFHQLIKRAWFAQTRRRTFIISRVGRCFLVGLVFGTLFLQMELNQTGIYNRSSLLYFSLMLGGMIGLGIIPIVQTERGVFYRENASGMYRVWIYLVTFILTDIPWVFVSAMAYTIPTYFLAGFTLENQAQPFFYHCLIIFTAYLNFSLFATFLACLLPNADEIGGALVSILSLYAGFLILPGSIPKGWKWFYHLDFLKYHLESLMVNEFKDLEFECPENKGAVPIVIDPIQQKVQWFCPTQRGQYELDRLQLNRDNLYLNLCVIFSFSIFFICAIYSCLRLIRHQVK